MTQRDLSAEEIFHITVGHRTTLGYNIMESEMLLKL